MGDQDREVVSGDGVVGGLLVGFQACGELERVRLPGVALVDDLQAAARLADQAVESGEKAARQDQVSVECLVVAA